MTLGVLTLATRHDYLKAIGLALSLKCSNPGLPLAVATSKELKSCLKPYFDFVIDEDPNIRGFVHKLYLDIYSPFDTTFFFDSDVLVFKPLEPVIAKWSGQAYVARGYYKNDGFSAFGLDRKNVLQKLGKQELVVIDGAGHALFKKPDCEEAFTRAREVAENYFHYAGNIKLADEDVMSIVMTMLDLAPAKYANFLSRHLSAKPGSLLLAAENAYCRFVEVSNDEVTEPVMMHFAANEGALSYAIQLNRLFKKFGVGINLRVRLINQMVRDLYIFYKNRVARIRNRIFNTG